MIIKKYLNTNESEIKSKKFNIFIGISLGNKYFLTNNLKQYILWALENTKEDVLILIADRIQAINYEVLNQYSKNMAEVLAIKKGIEVKHSIENIIKGLPKSKQKLIKICLWYSARKSDYYKDKIKIIIEEFENNPEFHNFIIKIVKENLGKKCNNLNKSQLERLSLYVLDELPILLNGVEFAGKIYTLHPYPGISSFDDLLIGLQEGTIFSQLAKKLEVHNKIAQVEAYPK